MIRSVTLVAVVAMALLAFGSQMPRPVPVAEACGGAEPFLEQTLDEAALVAVVRVVDAGGPENAAPTLTPTVTPTPTATPEAGETPVTPATATFVPPTFTPPDLTGFSATVEIIDSHVGPASGRVRIDDDARRDLEESVRFLEAVGSVPPPCPLTMGKYPYREGAQYVVIATRREGGGLNTVLRWEIEGDDVVLRRPTDEFGGNPLLITSRQTYDGYFSGVQAHFFDGSALVEADRVPLAAVSAAIEGLLGLTPPVMPPETGNAGLAAGR
jgi:hypothetical protein